MMDKIGVNGDDQDGVSDPSSGLLEGIRWTYFAIVFSVFTLGNVNFAVFLIKRGKWRTIPLLLMYISGQLTLAFAIARTVYPD